MYPRALTDLIKAFNSLPGIGPKTAERLATHLVHASQQQAHLLAQSIMRLKSNVHVCTICHTLSESDICAICADPERDTSLVCVVETPADLAALENAHSFRGVYHVLSGSLSPLEGMGPRQLKVESLRKRLQEGGVREILIATNPTVEGEATANLLLRSLQNSGVKLTRLAYGMPVGGNLQYMDNLTLSRALSGRTTLNSEE